MSIRYFALTQVFFHIRGVIGPPLNVFHLNHIYAAVMDGRSYQCMKDKMRIFKASASLSSSLVHCLEHSSQKNGCIEFYPFCCDEEDNKGNTQEGMRRAEIPDSGVCVKK